ncbi:hypothetical protein RYX36_034924, partial [Vicia faba]
RHYLKVTNVFSRILLNLKYNQLNLIMIIYIFQFVNEIIVTTHGFRKISSKRWEFQHEKFQKGCKQMLVEISRKKCEPSVFPSYLKSCSEENATTNNSSVEENTNENHELLMEENKNLKKEKLELQMQIAEYRSILTAVRYNPGYLKD